MWWILPAAIVGVLLLVGGTASWFIWGRPGPSPERLAATTVTSTSVSLGWSRPKTGTAPQRYVVRRNGAKVAEVAAETSYVDSGLSPLTAYRYSVLAVADGKLSHPTSNVVVTTRPAAPVGLSSGEVTATSVMVKWSPPPGVAPDRYIVRRDSSDLTTVPATTFSYRDTTLKPLTEVSYTLIAVTQGQLSDPSAAVQVKTTAPPVRDARLQDSWNVALTVTRAGGTRLKPGAFGTETWSFTPRCGTGACPVDMRGTLGGRPFTITLNRDGAVYRGSARANVAPCMKTEVRNTVALTVRVTEGAVSDGTWAASKWTASLDLSIPYTRVGNYYCPAQNAAFSATPESGAQGSTAPPDTT
jgi:hypothetical protein